jgi:hypothetical protein
MEFDNLNINVNFNWLESDEIDSNTIKSDYKYIHKCNNHKFKSDIKKDCLKNIMPEFPGHNEILHLITNGSYDLYNMVAYFIDKYKTIDNFIGSTWCMNAWNIKDLKEKYESKIINNITLITGDYFKLKQRSEYGQLAEFMVKNRLKYKSCKNHAKIMLLNKDNIYITIESSANFTTNPRVENFTLYSNKELYQFHENWILEAINDNKIK